MYRPGGDDLRFGLLFVAPLGDEGHFRIMVALRRSAGDAAAAAPRDADPTDAQLQEACDRLAPGFELRLGATDAMFEFLRF